MASLKLIEMIVNRLINQERPVCKDCGKVFGSYKSESFCNRYELHKLSERQRRYDVLDFEWDDLEEQIDKLEETTEKILVTDYCFPCRTKRYQEYKLKHSVLEFAESHIDEVKLLMMKVTEREDQEWRKMRGKS